MNTPLNVSMELRWLVSFTASCVHTAAAIAHGQLIADARMAEVIVGPAQILRQKIVSAGLPRTAFWRHLVGLCVVADGAHQLATRAVIKTIGSAHAETIARPIAAAIQDVEAAVKQAFPTLLDELSLRARPIREQWETQGPGLLHCLARITDPRLIVPHAHVVLVHPSLGGGGSAHLPYNNVLIEAVLTDPVPELPEFLRLGWLLAQLNLELPDLCAAVNGQRLAQIAELAMLPATLQAAEELGLLRLTPEIIDVALNSWHVVTPAGIDPVDVLWRWWGTFVDTRPRWEIAFAALDRMCGQTAAE